MKKGCLPGIVEAKEKDLGILVGQAKEAQGIPRPVEDKHGEDLTPALHGTIAMI